MASPRIALADTFWQIQSIDTMKYSRDRARDPDYTAQIPHFVAQIAALKPNYIALSTPYDEEFYPVLRTWVDEARVNNLKVWFRGNFSSWEGWFDYPKFTDPKEHHTLTAQFIKSHPELFQDGDIFTPVPEPENGGMGDPRQSSEKTKEFNQFLVDSYKNCVDSFRTIGKRIKCGYFSTNGDVARDIITRQTATKIGRVIVIDHYIKNPHQLSTDITYLHNKLNSQIVLGEFGAPIPDINGEMDEQTQADFVKELLEQLVKVKEITQGVNYWTAFDSSTQLFDSINDPKIAAETIKSYFEPTLISGKVENTILQPLGRVTVTAGSQSAQTDSRGHYKLLIPSQVTPTSLTAQIINYKTATQSLSLTDSTQSANLVLEPEKPSTFYQLRLRILQTLEKFRK